MINEVREAYPGSNVTLLVPEQFADLYESHPAIDGIIKLPAAHVHGMIAVVKIKELVAPHQFHLCYILPPSFGAAAAFKLAGIKERVGYIADGRRLLLTRPFALPAPLNCQHRSLTYFDLLRRATGLDLSYEEPKLFLNEADDAKAAQVLAGFGVGESDRYATLAFRAVAESRRWGATKYIDLAKALIRRYNFKIVLMGSSEDHRVGEEIVAAVGSDRASNLAGKTSL
ncbi:MAG TPA: glycosyltransferase family 9 protein, partial [Candidatus Acidoferrum sp.]|nr:glycosyltransferase family 9 protein [Candidatus Acidoferrum sp.]